MYPGLADKLAQAVQPIPSQLQELKERKETKLDYDYDESQLMTTDDMGQGE